MRTFSGGNPTLSHSAATSSRPLELLFAPDGPPSPRGSPRDMTMGTSDQSPIDGLRGSRGSYHSEKPSMAREASQVCTLSMLHLSARCMLTIVHAIYTIHVVYAGASGEDRPVSVQGATEHIPAGLPESRGIHYTLILYSSVCA